MLGAVVGAGAGAARVHIRASSLLQLQPVRMAMTVASIRYVGQKVMVYFRYWLIVLKCQSLQLSSVVCVHYLKSFDLYSSWSFSR